MKTVELKYADVVPLNKSHDFGGAIIGMVLGDSSLFTTAAQYKLKTGERSVHIPGRNTVSLQLAHSMKHMEYLVWKASIIRNYVHFNCLKSHTATLNGKSYETIYARSIGSRKLSFLYPRMYRGFKKIVNRKALNRLTELGLAIWYMDDGCIVKRKNTNTGIGYWPGRSIFLATDCFTREEVVEIQKYFNERWNIKTSIVKSKKNFCIWMNCHEAEKFFAVVRPHVLKVNCMKYKLPEFSVSTEHL